MKCDRIYVRIAEDDNLGTASIEQRPFTELYIRKDLVDETIKTAEDHAYFAGQEKLREKLMEWAKELKFLVKDEPGASFKGAEVVINEVIKKIQSL